MDFIRQYPEYLPVAPFISAANIERVPVLAEAIATVVVDLWQALQAPPAPAAVIIERRRTLHLDDPRAVRYSLQ